VQSFVVDIGRYSLNCLIVGIDAWISVKLLLVANKVLQTVSQSFLESLCITVLPTLTLSGESTAQVGIIREAFPIATTFCNSTQRANNRPKGDIDALGPELSTHIHTSCVGEVFIPARSHRYA
jgi:hypothetical protein